MKTEPVALIAAIAVIIVWAASLFHVVLDTSTVENLLLTGIAIVTAVLQRSKVSPV